MWTNPTVIYEDNQPSIELMKQVQSRRVAKHYELRLRFLQERSEAGDIRFVKAASKAQIADIFTKPLAAPEFCKLRDQLFGITAHEAEQMESDSAWFLLHISSDPGGGVTLVRHYVPGHYI